MTLQISHQFNSNESGALRSLTVNDNRALIEWNTSDKVYTFDVKNDSTISKWYEMIQNPESDASFSWGSDVNRARVSGDIVEVN